MSSQDYEFMGRLKIQKRQNGTVSSYCSKECSPNNKDKSTTVQGSNQMTRSPSKDRGYLVDPNEFTQTLIPIAIRVQRLEQDQEKDFYHIKSTEYKNYKYQKHDLKHTKFNFLENIKMMQPVTKNSKWRNYSNYLPRVSLSALKNEFLIQNTLSDYLIEECAIPKLASITDFKNKQLNLISDLIQNKMVSFDIQNDQNKINQLQKSIKMKRFENNFSIIQQEKTNLGKKRLITKKCPSLPHLVSSSLYKSLYQKEQPSYIQILNSK